MSLKFTSNNFFGGDIKKLYLESFVKKFQEHKEIQLQNTLPVKTLNGSLFYFQRILLPFDQTGEERDAFSQKKKRKKLWTGNVL